MAKQMTLQSFFNTSRCNTCHRPGPWEFTVVAMLRSVDTNSKDNTETNAYFVRYICMHCGRENDTLTKYIVRKRSK